MNYIAQFLFQELKDTARVRRHAIKVINREIQDFKETKLAKLLLEDISVRILNSSFLIHTFIR